MKYSAVLRERLVTALSSKDLTAVGAVAIDLVVALGLAEDALLSLRESRKADAERKRLRRERAGYVSPSLRYAVLRRDRFRCCACGASVADGARLHVDHITPVAAGGTSDEHNLQSLCDDCNLGKGARDV